ncbi:MAG: hypothetical protein ABI178_08880 [Rhodanobacter sp.]
MIAVIAVIAGMIKATGYLGFRHESISHASLLGMALGSLGGVLQLRVMRDAPC